MSQFLYGVHDSSADWAIIIRDAGVTGWAVISEEIRSDPTNHSGRNYSALAQYGVTPIVRLNNGYYPDGTIPQPGEYAAFAQRCANFVTASPGCTRWVIGNETNLAGERPYGVTITPTSYADCFSRCRSAIKQRGGQHEIIPAAVAPYNQDTGWCIDYWQQMLGAIISMGAGDAGCDGLALHTYSRGGDPQSIYSEDTMNPPYDAYYNGFKAYKDFLDVVPAIMRALPVYITEIDQNEAWVDADSGWVRNAYDQIDAWNHIDGSQRIYCLALYRWENYDKWAFKDKHGVVNDFKASLAMGYQSPTELPEPPEPTPPTPTPEPEPEPEPIPLEWDSRLDTRGCTLSEVAVPEGEYRWAVTCGRWFDEQEAQGRTSIYIRLLDERGELAVGMPVMQFWSSGDAIKESEVKH